LIGIAVAIAMPGTLENQTLMNFLHIKEMFYHI
jgi:UDP-N-acetylglucosamine--dolichyl-phosphate N-acetylglucosaminephosphotransferase